MGSHDLYMRFIFVSFVIGVGCLGRVFSGDHVIVKRQFSARCGLEKLLCTTSDSVCDPGKSCTEVIETFSQFGQPLCEYDCQPITTPQPNVTATESANTNGTDDPSECTANFVCYNGGNCSLLYKSGVKIPPQCHCPPGFDGLQCQYNCSKQCFNNATCRFLEGEQRCVCPHGFEQPDCQFRTATASAILQEGEIWYIPVIICITILLLLMLGYFILLKLRGRSLFVTKLFHFLQPYEDDDGKLFDAFISFRSSKKDFSQSDDEKFVLRVLQPILEKEFQYNVCVHYRDFQPGETIANNIMWAVENSRRTILILSPLYVESEWARLEYQKAQQEMLQLRHKIIPIIYEDISNTRIEDPTLKHILSSVTYIIYPHDSDEKASSKFWEMLQLALPKKRSTDSEASTQERNSNSNAIPNLSSQESWQSTATDITEVEGSVAKRKVKSTKNAPVIILQDLDKIQVLEKHGKASGDKKKAVHVDVEKYMAVLEDTS